MTLLTNARVVKLETNGSGNEVSAVVVEVDGKTERFAADIVVAACGAANTAKLLLASANDQHPNGLANGSDQVGRNYMFHDSLAVLALSEEENPTVFQKTLGLNDFYFGSDDFEFPLGNIQMVGKSSSQMYRGEKPGQTKLAPEWTLEKVAKHAIDFWLSTEDLPSPDNRVTLAPDGNVRLAYSETNAEARKRLYEKLRSLLPKLNMNEGHLFHRFAYMKNEIPVAGVAHQAGTCRFGTDPASSVLNTDCRAHEVDNLYVVDTSIFPSIGAVNPALTAMANSLRVGDHLLERLGAMRRSRRRRRVTAVRRRSLGRADRDLARRPARRRRRGRRRPAGVLRGGRELLDAYPADGEITSGRGQVLIPWPNRIEDGATSSTGGDTSSRSTSSRRGTRSTGSSAGPPGGSASASRAASCSSTCSSRSPAIRSARAQRSSTPSPMRASRSRRPPPTSARTRARTAAASIPT